MGKTFGERLKELRVSKNLSQKDLADILRFNKSVLNRLESGEREPQYAHVKHLCEVLEVPVSELLQYTAMGEKSVLSELSVFEPARAKTLEYVGMDEVYSGYIAYAEELEKQSEIDDWRREFGGIDGECFTDWTHRNQFFVLVSPVTGAVRGFRTFGRNITSAGELFMLTGNVPVYVFGFLTMEGFESQIQLTRRRYLDELEKARAMAKFKKPLFLIEYICKNSYYALDLSMLDAGKPYDCARVVYDYKRYLPTFKISSYAACEDNEIVDGHGYCVYMPSKEFICETGIELYPIIAELQMSWDEWFKREPWASSVGECELSRGESAFPGLIDLHAYAVGLVNRGRKEEFGIMDAQFSRLEILLRRLENLLSLCAPPIILGDVVVTLSKHIDAMSSTMSIFLKKNYHKAFSSPFQVVYDSIKKSLE